MVIKFVRSNQYFEIDEGSVITENYNETLDSAVIKISNLSNALDLEPYDKVILIDPDGDPLRYMCIDQYQETMICNNPVLYNYEISLFSETKLLEGIILPNLSITQLRDGSPKRSVWYYLEQYLREYKGNADWTFNSRVQAKFENIECPEMQWNMPTLREVLNDLMMIGDCIVTMSNSGIGFIDITQKKNEIDISKINYIQRSQSSADYVSELQMNMVNVMQEDATVYSLSGEAFTSDEALIKDTNVVLKTKFPILRLKHLYISFYVQLPGDATFQYYGYYDLMNYIGVDEIDGNYVSWREPINLVAENDEYVTKEIFNVSLNAEPNDFKQWQDYQNFCLKYSRYDNTIDGFNEIKKVGIFQLNWTYLLHLKRNLLKYDPDFIDMIEDAGLDLNATLNLWASNTDDYAANDWKNTRFYVEYETNADQTFRASKDIITENKNRNRRIVIDNQTNSFVDAKAQGHLEYQKANRLGNQQLVINCRTLIEDPDLVLYPEIGDYYGDSIVYQVQYQIFKNHVESISYATKDYILKNYFTGIKSKVRTWVNAKDEALERHDLDKYYLEFSESEEIQDYFDNISPIDNLRDLFDFIDSSFAGKYLKDSEFVKYSAVKTFSKDGDVYPITGLDSEQNEIVYAYLLPVVNRIIGNSMVFTFGFDNNYSINKRIDKDTQISGGLATYWYMYADKNVENIKTAYALVNKFDNLPTSQTLLMDCEDLMEIAFNYPRVEEWRFSDFTKMISKVNVHKDNREITKISTQLEFCRNTNKIEFTEDFIKLCSFVRRKERVIGDIIPGAGYIQSKISLTESVSIGPGEYRLFTYNDYRLVGAHNFNFTVVGTQSYTATLVSHDIKEGNVVFKIENPNDQGTIAFRVMTFNWTASWYQFKIYEDGIENPDAIFVITDYEASHLFLRFDFGNVSNNKTYEIKDGTGATLLKSHGLKLFYLNILKYRN